MVRFYESSKEEPIDKEDMIDPEETPDNDGEVLNEVPEEDEGSNHIVEELKDIAKDRADIQTTNDGKYIKVFNDKFNTFLRIDIKNPEDSVVINYDNSSINNYMDNMGEYTLYLRTISDIYNKYLEVRS